MDKTHGSPYDRGSADRYYGRHFNPHYYEYDGDGYCRISQESMTKEEIQEYTLGWEEETDSKY